MKIYQSFLQSFHLLRFAFEACPKRIGTEIISVFCSLANSMFVRIYIVKVILDYVIASNLRAALIAICVAAIFDLLTSAYGGWIEEYRKVTNIQMHKYFQSKMYRNAVEIDYQYYDKPEFYNQYMMAAQNSDTTAAQYLVKLNGLLVTIGEVAITGVLILNNMPYLAFIVLIPASLYGIISAKSAGIRVEMTEAAKPLEKEAEYVKRIFFLKKYAMDIRFSRVKEILFLMFDHSNAKLLQTIKPFARKRFKYSTIQGMLFYFQYLAIIIMLSWRTLVQRDLSVGDISMLMGSAIALNNNWRYFGSMFGDIAESGGFVMKYMNFLNIVEESATQTQYQSIASQDSDLLVKDIAFRYEKQYEMVLKNVSIAIRSGQKVAIVGPNGVGKTTLIHLILRLYNPEAGEISLGGVPVQRIEPDAYRERFSFIFQDFQLYPFTIAENILLRVPMTTDDEIKIMSALEKVGLSGKINALPNGINTVLTNEFSSEGSVFSGGEMQRLALARALVRLEENNAMLLLMDEPTCNLDPVAESEINRLIIELFESKSMIIISHRLSTIVGVDYIYLLNKTGIEEEGSHETLMQLNRHYAKIYRLQAQLYSMESNA